MSSVFRRINPLSWSVKTINIVFSCILATLAPLYIFFATTTLAQEAPIATLTIGSISLHNAEVVSAPPENRTLPTPDTQVGLYSPSENLTFLYGHSTTIFQDLDEAQLADTISFTDLETNLTETYQITNLTTEHRSNISMSTLLADPGSPTLILMTCAGNFDPAIDTYDARLIIHAQKLN